MKANFLIVGGKRCGTTSLWAYLREHPGIHVANEKELNYFSELYDKEPVLWYDSNFIPMNDPLFQGEYVEGSTPTGEASPTYCFHPDTMGRIYTYNQHMKLIMILRDPVHRAISHYHWEVRMQNEKRTIYEALLADDMEVERYSQQYLFGYKAWGRYVEQLDRIFSWFFPGMVLITSLEQLASQPQHTMNQVTHFLRAPEWDGYSWVRYLETEKPIPPHEVVTHLRAYFAPFNEQLVQKYGIDIRVWES